MNSFVRKYWSLRKIPFVIALSMSFRLGKSILTVFKVLLSFFTNLRAVPSGKLSFNSAVILESVKTSSFGTSLMITEWYFCSFRGLLQIVSVPMKVNFHASSISLDSSWDANSRWIWPLVVLNAYINFFFGNAMERLRLMSVLFLKDVSVFLIRSTAVTSRSIVAFWVIALTFLWMQLWDRLMPFYPLHFWQSWFWYHSVGDFVDRRKKRW